AGCRWRPWPAPRPAPARARPAAAGRAGSGRGGPAWNGGTAWGSLAAGAANEDAARGRRPWWFACCAYLRLSSIQSTVAWTCSSVSAGLPPLGGITPALPVKPSMACLYSVSLPWAMREAHAPWDRVGAPPTPPLWQAPHRFWKITEPSVVPP